MARTKVSPLDWKTMIVDPETGCPTLQFIQLWQQLFGNEEGTNETAEDALSGLNAKADKVRQIIAGAGLTGGGDLSADRTLDVGAGTGITVNANDVAIDTAAEAERVRDTIGTALVAGSNISITVNDGADTITIAGTVNAVTYASASEIRTGTEAAKAIAPDQLIASAAPQTLTDGATIAWNMASGYNAKVTLGGNRTLGTPTNPKLGLTYVLEVIQDGTGSRTMTWPSGVKWGSAGTPTLSTAAGKRDLVFLYCYDATTPEFRAAFNKDA